jgi:hypothetical protein
LLFPAAIEFFSSYVHLLFSEILLFPSLVRWLPLTVFFSVAILVIFFAELGPLDSFSFYVILSDILLHPLLDLGRPILLFPPSVLYSFYRRNSGILSHIQPPPPPKIYAVL